MKMVELCDLKKEYPGVKALQGVSFSLEEKSLHGFLGPNGAGKSTTIKILCGLLNPTSGQVKIRGEKLSLKHRNLIGYLPEQLPLYDDLTVEDYMRFIFELKSLPTRERKKTIEESYNLWGLEGRQKSLISHLSKGFRQRLGLAQAFLGSPPLIVLDEPFNGLDPISLHQLRETIRELKSSHCIFFSSHQLNEVKLLSDELTILSEGKVVAKGPLHEVLSVNKAEQIIEVNIKNQNPSLLAELKEIDFVDRLEQEEERIKFFLPLGDDYGPRLAKIVVEKGGEISGFQSKEYELEDFFIHLMEGGKHDQTSQSRL